MILIILNNAVNDNEYEDDVDEGDNSDSNSSNNSNDIRGSVIIMMIRISE